jgi:hypothetical protein
MAGKPDFTGIQIFLPLNVNKKSVRNEYESTLEQKKIVLYLNV